MVLHFEYSNNIGGEINEVYDKSAYENSQKLFNDLTASLLQSRNAAAAAMDLEKVPPLLSALWKAQEEGRSAFSTS